MIKLSYQEIVDLAKPAKEHGSWRDAISGIASLGDAGPGDLSFLGSSKYIRQVEGCRASIVLVPEGTEREPNAAQTYLYCENPSFALDQICGYIENRLSPRPEAGIHATAWVDPSARIGEGVHVGPQCVVEAETEVGDGSILMAQSFVGRAAVLGEECWLRPQVSVYNHSRLGKRVMIHSGTVVGSDGYGYETVKGKHIKSPQIGIVNIGDDVEIGANCTIDRARFGITTIGDGSKIDNRVHIAHNVTVGKGCLLVAGVGIAGSTKLGDYVVIGGNAGVAGHLKIGDYSRIGGGSGVVDDLEPKSFVFGYPSMPFMKAQRYNTLRERVPELFRRVDALERKMGESD